jgi:hypothetical protein
MPLGSKTRFVPVLKLSRLSVPVVIINIVLVIVAGPA